MSTWTSAHSTALLAILIFIGAIGWISAENAWIVGGWLATLALMAAAMVVAGHGVVGVWRGALIDSTNCISLSRFQMTLWTLLVLSTFASAAMWNVVHGVAEPLKIAIPNTIWLLMGISTTSLVGSPLLTNDKKNWDPSRKEVAELDREMEKQGDSPSAITTKGLVVANADPSLARWSDLFTGEEVANATRLDLSRLQMLFFTLITAFAYAVALAHQFAGLGSEEFAAFPALDQSTLALIGISHAGYLTAKAVTQTDRVPKAADSPATVADADDTDGHLDGCHLAVSNPTADDQLPRARGGVA